MRAVLDIETGGFGSTAGIVEAALLVFDDDYKPVHEYSSIIQPYFQEGLEVLMKYSEKAAEVHGISYKDQCEEGRDPREVVKDMEKIIQDYKVEQYVGHSILKFDAPKMDDFFRRFSKYEKEYYFDEVFDTLIAVRQSYPDLPMHNLDFLCREFGIINPDPHRALGDCHATLKLLEIIAL